METRKNLDGLKVITHNAKRKARIIYYRKLLRAKRQLIKATLLLSITPFIVLAIMVIYERLTLVEGMMGAGIVLVCSVFFAKPYMEDLSSLGIELDENKNNASSKQVREINTEKSKIKILVCPTNEELEIAQQAKDVIEAN